MIRRPEGRGLRALIWGTARRIAVSPALRSRASRLVPLEISRFAYSDVVSEAVMRLACLLGRHSWTTRVDHGEQFTVCSICGQEKKGGGSSSSSAIPHADDGGPEGLPRRSAR
jgi:hypothetical protein